MSTFARIGRGSSSSAAPVIRHRFYSQFVSSLSPYIRLSPRVKEALDNGEPVVALESTIISHGMPYPQNIETARLVEGIIAKHGSTPATIALIDGKINVGLGEEELERLGKSGKLAIKTSRRDMAAVLSQRRLGATTVSGTMIAAHMAGIPIFATGGIGGVHRGAELTMDISADLTELGRTPVAVVCAGAKSILDLPKTLEYLETQGVSVVAYGDAAEFPAFFSPRSGLSAPWNLQTPEEVASLIRVNMDIGLQTGQVIAVPIPSEYAGASSEIESAIETALCEAKQQGIKGKESTPFLLKRVVELTGGASLTANIALVKNNARIASQIAKSLAGMKSSGLRHSRLYTTAACRNASPSLQTQGSNKQDRVKVIHSERPLLVVGGAAIDVTSQVDSDIESSASQATSYPGAVVTSIGGVGQNIARAAHFMGADTVLISAIGHDIYGDTIKAALEEIGMDTHSCTVYNALHAQNGDLIMAVADMDINGMVSAQQIQEAFVKLSPGVVGLDGNISALAISTAVTMAAHMDCCVVFEPTSVPKCTSMLSALSFVKRSETFAEVGRLVHIITPNRLELERMAESAPLADTVEEIAEQHYALDTGLIRDALTLFPLFQIQIIKLGEKGAAVVSPSPNLVINSNGAGDSLVGAFGADGYLKLDPQDIDCIVNRAQKAAILSLESLLAVSESSIPS
ncbi:Indigoidine synthase A like protein-domain-containing protein [Kickxella alabastrina]|uniref:Indigoidine synthase A like protein-domain-containing protein n=1 Tax=Kickxella alabastrina TaxID=61397 RepID=UPI00221FB8FC|nr:Indigoidine synthase A like protein-domain-containing protein [Kickxella alabastrina]KAI7827801.1 Indigoidine synthase A like protein-domain-containing protein [Kickxella alabastrina]